MSDKTANKSSAETRSSLDTNYVGRWFRGIGIVLVALLVAGRLVRAAIPTATGNTISGILTDIAIAVVVCASPFLIVILWNLRTTVSRVSFVGSIGLLVGVSLALLALDVLLVSLTILSHVIPKEASIPTIAGITFLLAGVVVFISMLIIIVQAVLKTTATVRNRRAAHRDKAS